jgi:hypothetical protein
MIPSTFNDLPLPLRLAIVYRAELEHFGWPDYAFVGYGSKLVGVPLDADVMPQPPNSTLITVHLRLPDRLDTFDVVLGYLDNATWPTEESVAAAIAAWNRLSQDERNEARRTLITREDAARFGMSLLERGFYPPALDRMTVPPGRH